jgi:hypothetical protein
MGSEENDIERAIWAAAEQLPVIGPWVKIAKFVRDLFDGDESAALQAIRAIELQRRAENDERLGR